MNTIIIQVMQIMKVAKAILMQIPSKVRIF